MFTCRPAKVHLVSIDIALATQLNTFFYNWRHVDKHAIYKNRFFRFYYFMVFNAFMSFIFFQILREKKPTKTRKKFDIYEKMSSHCLRSLVTKMVAHNHRVECFASLLNFRIENVVFTVKLWPVSCVSRFQRIWISVTWFISILCVHYGHY